MARHTAKPAPAPANLSPEQLSDHERVAKIEAALAPSLAPAGEFNPADAREVLAECGGAGAFPAAYKAATGRECCANGWPVYQGHEGRLYSTDPHRQGTIKASEVAF